MAADLISNLLSDIQLDESGTPLPTSDYDTNLKGLAKFVREADERELTQQVDGNDLLDLLDPTRNTISYLAVLTAHVKLAQKTRQQSPSLIAHTLAFLTTFDPVQARYLGSELRHLLHWLGSYSEATNDVSVIPAIGGAILHLDPSGSTFTSTHLYYVRLCLAAALPRQALPVLDKDVYNFPTDPIKGVDERELCAPHESSATYITRSSGVSADISVYDVQEYYLLGAQVYLGLRQWARAKIFLELVLVTPTSHVASPLMVEAYKKLVLLSLLLTGRPFSTKGILEQQVLKTIASLSKAYEALVDAFNRRHLQKFMAEVDTGLQIWTDDGNLGLVNQVAESLRRYRVIDLQKTYSALPIDRIAVNLSLSPNATIDLLTTMIHHGHIKATLSPQAGDGANAKSPPVLRFLSHEPTQVPLGLDQDAIIQAKYQQIDRLSKHVKEADRKLAITKDYVDFVRRSKRAEGAGATGYEDPMEDDWNGPNADEDIMAG